jgi:hypothetical protein
MVSIGVLAKFWKGFVAKKTSINIETSNLEEHLKYYNTNREIG